MQINYYKRVQNRLSNWTFENREYSPGSNYTDLPLELNQAARSYTGLKLRVDFAIFSTYRIFFSPWQCFYSSVLILLY